jgi:hypothetical protein
MKQSGEKKLVHNYNINFFHILSNYNKLDEWENHNWFDLMQLWCTITRVQTFESISIHVEFHPISMCSNEWTFHEPTKHNRLQDVINMFTMHICPIATQISC